MKSHVKSALLGCAMALALIPAALWAQDAPLSYQASPDIYKVLKENPALRMTLGTWQPGQRDAFHSHSTSAAYFIDGCLVRVFGPDGNITWDGYIRAGYASVSDPVAKHSIQNVGTSVCRVLNVELK